MIEISGDLWAVAADARCITTNGIVNSSGHAVMGRGCARQAADRFPGLALSFGALLKRRGNHVLLLDLLPDDSMLFSFPVKHHWREDADLELIARSARELVATAELHGFKSCIIPRPGCGNGRLSWEREVRPVLISLLDDRFKIITNAKGAA